MVMTMENSAATAAKVDWNDLTSKSVPSLWSGIGGGGEAPTSTSATAAATEGGGWNRSMASLQIASQSLLEQPGVRSFTGGGGGLTSRWKATTSATTTTPGTAPLQAGGRMDATTTTTLTNDGTSSRPLLRKKTVEEAVAEHEESILQTLRVEYDTAINQDCMDRVEDHLTQSWERGNLLWLEEIGVVAASSKHDPSTTRIQDATNRRQQQQQSRGGRILVPSQQAVLPGQSSARMDPQLIQAHGRIVQDLPRLTPDQAAHEFGLVYANSSNNNTAVPPAFRGCATAWNWMTHVLQYQQQRSSHRGTTNTMTATDQAIATVIHFCQQFQHTMEQTIQAAMASGQADLIQSTYTHAVAQNCQAYSKLLLGDSTTTKTSTSTPWSTLYFCLRCGSAAAALQVWQIAATSSLLTPRMSQAVAHAITELLVALSSPWGEAALSGPPQLPRSHRHVVADYLQGLVSSTNEGASTASDPSTPQPSPTTTPATIHEIGFLALLSGTGNLPIDNSTHGFCTIEDFLFGRINQAVLQQDPNQQLIVLGNSIQDYGASYFGDTESGGWSYTLPLLMTQQYAKGLTHLVDHGTLGLLQATHLGLLLSSNGIPLVDLGSSSHSAKDDDLAASLLVAYAGQLVAEPVVGGALAALEYLTLIPQRDRMRKEVATLIAKTGDLQNLVGRVDGNGVRQPPATGSGLDRTFSQSEIGALLTDAAELILRGTSSSKSHQEQLGTAVMCFLLAGRYDSVLRFLCDQLVPPNVYDTSNHHNKNDRRGFAAPSPHPQGTHKNDDTIRSRQFWMDQTQQFHQCYLDKRTRVTEVLERERKLSLVHTSKCLMDLNVFFQHLQNCQYFEAWTVARGTGLLPVDHSDMAASKTCIVDWITPSKRVLVDFWRVSWNVCNNNMP